MKLDLARYIPDEVAEFIDEQVMPAYADGKTSAKQIARYMLFDAIERVESYASDLQMYYLHFGNFALVDSYIKDTFNLPVIEAFIQSVFNSWEENDV